MNLVILNGLWALWIKGSLEPSDAELGFSGVHVELPTGNSFNACPDLKLWELVVNRFRRAPRHTGFPAAPKMRDPSPLSPICQSCPLLSSPCVSGTVLSAQEAMKTWCRPLRNLQEVYYISVLFIPHLKDKVQASTFPLPGLTVTHDSLSWELACFFNWLLDLAWLKEEPCKIHMPKRTLSLHSFLPCRPSCMSASSIILKRYIFVLSYWNTLNGSALPTGQTLSHPYAAIGIYPTGLKKPCPLLSSSLTEDRAIEKNLSSERGRFIFLNIFF